ncbi:MAG: ydaH [Moraxellaceae bacterium]|jgi:aminobenzoyl-glutamate transport protein|nr:ydaH [Moraxellaceae bacterium]
MATPLLRLLDRLEAAGNRLPSPTWLFVWLCGFVLLLSALVALSGWQVTWPDGSRTVTAVNLLSAAGLRRILTDTVSNFTGFAPVGPVIVAMLGLGLAERAGLLGGLLAALVQLTRRRGLPFLVAFAGVLSHVALDAGYVVVIPLAALLFHRAGLPPLAGIACAFAGVSGGYAANLLISPADAMLAGITTEAARTVAPAATVAITANYWFMAASSFLVAGVIAAVTHWLVIPRLSDTTTEAIVEVEGLHPAGALAVAIWTLILTAFCLWGLLPESGFLRGEDGSMLKSPLLQGIVVLVAVYFGIAGLLYGRLSGVWQKAGDCVPALEDTLRLLAGYLVLMFFAAQFVAWFKWSQLGEMLAITGAGGLRALDLSPVLLLVGFVLLTALVDLFIGSASAKWALMAPVFVPMFLLAGVAPEATQAAYRVGDSTANIITPLMPYFAMVVAFAQRWQKDTGIGTLMALMLPYSLALLLAWTAFLALWLGMGWPLGPQ